MSFERTVSLGLQPAKEKSGGAYYFKSWSPKTEEIPKRQVQYLPGKEDGFAEWRNFMKEYLKEKTEDDKPAQSTCVSPIRHDNIAWTAHVEGARQIHMKKAREVAQAVSTSKELKSTKMFQQRFEISEKYALVKDPGESKQDIELHNERETGEESIQSVPVEQQPVEQANPTPYVDKLDITLLQNLPAVHKLPDDLGYLTTPEPWKIKPESIPLPTYKNFNRSARGFVGSYLTSYY